MDIVDTIIKVYYKLPMKPFRGLAAELYRKYISPTKDKVIVAVRNGIKYELDLRESIDMQIYFRGCFEPDTTLVINKYVKSGMTILDIGANVGAHTLRLAKLVGKDGKVIAFEPMSWALAKLKRNIGLNDFDNIVVEECALSDINFKSQLTHFSSSWRVGGGWAADSGTAEHIGFVTLDEYARINKMDKIDFIKLDVDGYECKVIRGGVNTIKKFTPIMIVEFGKCTLERYGDSLGDLVDLLFSLGYLLYSIEDLKLYPSKKSALDAVPPNKTINVLCKPRAIVKT